ncbi:hypothetical protein CGRA01v4_09469 [Colletotrichum graminicola]|nr:hypothetical protein CGRA01v4_09469 [Colletotrichum graminicola]
MSANIDLIRGADGQLLYKASDGHWYLYSSLAYSSPSYGRGQQCLQDSIPPQHSTQHEELQYDDEYCEAGSFQGDSHYNDDSRKATSSRRGQSQTRVREYVNDQIKDKKYRDEPCDNSRSRRRIHKKSTKKNIDEILKPFQS